jgi:F5/8 type C domain-containing protein
MDEQQQQTQMRHAEGLEPTPNATSTQSRWREIVSLVCLTLVGLALLDTAIETSLGRAGVALRLSVALLVLAFFVLLGISWKRTQWATKALASVFFSLVLAGVTAWLPGGLDNGIVVARQPTSSVLEALTGLAVLIAGVAFVRLRVPLWLRSVGAVLAAYGLSAFVLALVTGQSFVSLFHEQSFWAHMPMWLQGAFIGAALIPLAILANVTTVLLSRRHRPTQRWHWQVDVSLALAAVIAAAGFVSHTSSAISGQGESRSLPGGSASGGIASGGIASGGIGSGGIVDLVHHVVSGDELTDVNVALEDNGGAIEVINGIWHSGRPDTVPPGDVPSEFCGGGFNGRRLIDGRMEPIWAGDPPNDPSNPPHPVMLPAVPVEIVLSFYRHQTALVGAVVITPGKDPARAPKDVEISVSNASPGEGFQNVGSGTLPADSGVHKITFPPVEARYLKVRVLSNQGGVDSGASKPTVEIAELQVLEARRKGYVSIRDRNPDLPNWKGSPRYAAQRGIEWLQPAAIGWGMNQNCFGCHIQSQAAMGLAVAAKNDYIVSHKCTKDLADFTVAKQQQDGSYIRADEGSTQFAAMGLSYWDDLEGVKQNPALLKSVDYLLTKQKGTGDMPYGSPGCDGLAVVQGPIMATANSLVAFKRASAETHDVRYKEAADRAFAWIAAAQPPNEGFSTQDKVFKILTLAKFGGPEQKPAIQQLVEELIRDQRPTGGWSECTLPDRPPNQGDWGGFREANPFSTGQVLYAFKQAGVSITSSPFIKGVKYLLGAQKEDGSWAADSNIMHTMGASYAPTMWAVIGLAGSFGQITTGGLQIVAEMDPAKAVAARNLEIILDVSGSMISKLGKSTRIGTARQVLRDVLAKLPDDFNVGLRVYAHRYSYKDAKRSCTDTELLVPIQKLDRQRILSTVDNLKPRGDTPLIYSVRQTPGDLKAVGGGSVIVITDGQETCSGDQEHTRKAAAEAAEELKAAGFPVTLNIVGFTLKGTEKERAEQVMLPFAEATGGHYYYAENGEALARALSLAALNKFPYEVFDSSGQQVAKGQAGPLSEALQPGDYKVVVHAGDQELTEQVRVTAKTDTVLKIVGQGERFVLEHDQAQAEQPAKQTAVGQGTH